MFNTYIIILLICAVIVLVALILYFNQSWISAISNMVGLNEIQAQIQNNETKTTVENTEKSLKPELVLYYAMWCQHSKNFLPEWEKFVAYAKQNLPQINVSSIRCEGGDEATCLQKGIEGYPMVVLYKDDGEKNFMAERTMEKLVEFVEENI